MKDSLQPGLTHEAEERTAPEHAASHLGVGPGVYSTPAMIALMERTCAGGVRPHLDAGEVTVGTAVNVRHRAAVSIGETVRCRVELTGVRRRRLVFAVRVTHGDTLVGDGTHERMVVDMERFGT